MDFAQFLQGQGTQPQAQQPVAGFSQFLQKTMTGAGIQPAAPQNSFKNFLNQKLSVTGVNNTQAPPPPAKPITDSGLEEQLEPILQKNPFLGSPMLTHFISSMVSTLATPVYDAAQYAYGQNLLKGKLPNANVASNVSGNNTNSTPSTLAGNYTLGGAKDYFDQDSKDVLAQAVIRQSLLPVYTDANGQARTVLNDLPITGKTSAQIFGDVAQSIMTVYAPDLGADLLVGGLTKTAAGETLLRVFAKASTEGAINFGLPFGVAQAFSSGTKDPKEFASIVAQNMVYAGLFSGAVGSAIPAAQGALELTDKVKAHISSLQDGQYYGLRDKGYTHEQAYALSRHGGYVGNILGENAPTETDGLSPIETSQVKQQGFITSVKESPIIAKDIADSVEGSYRVSPDKVAIQKAATLISEDPQAAKQLAMGDQMDKDSIATGVVLLKDANKRYIDSTRSSSGPDFSAIQDAKDLAQRLANKGTQAGQTAQAFSLLGKDLADPNKALVATQRFLDEGNRAKMPLFDQHITQIGKAITDLNGQIADQVIQELFPKVEEPVTGTEPEIPKPKVSRKPTMTDVTPTKQPLNLPRTPLQDLIYAENLLGSDTGQFGEKSPEQRLSDKVKLEQAVKKAPKPVQDMINTLYKIAQEDLPAKGKTVPRDPIELMGQAIRDKATYRDVFAKAQKLVQIKYQGNPEALAQLEQYFSRDLSNELPVAEKQVSKSMQNQMKEDNTKLAEVVKQHYTVQDSTGKSLAQKISEKADVSPEDAQALSDRIQQKFNELSKAKKQSMLTQMFKERKLPVSKTDIQKINELTNLGGFDQSAFRDSIAKRLGLTTLSDANAKMIMDRSLDIQTLPDGAEKSYKTNLLRKMIADLRPVSKTGLALGIWKQGLFSVAAPKKLGGELSMQALEGASSVVATALDKIASVFSGERTRAFGLSAFGKTLSSIPDAAKSSLDFLHGEVGSGIMSQLSDQMGKYDISDFKHGTKYSQNETVNMWANLPSRILGMTTDFFQNISLPTSLLEQSKVQAINEGLKGADLKARVKELYSNPTDDMSNKAIDHALFMTFQDNSNFAEAGSLIKRGIAKLGGEVTAQVSLPVYKTPANIFARLIQDYGPLAFPKTVIDQIRGGFDQEKLVTSLGRASTGSALMFLGGWLASRGLMTGNYPSTREERANWAAEGKTSNSVLIDGQWRNLGTSLAPVGELMGLGSDMQSLSKDNSGVALASQAIFSTIKKVGDMPMLYGLSSELQAIQQPEQFGQIAVENIEASAIPAVVRQTARAIDPTKRNPQGFLQQIEARVPGLTGNVPVARDVFGQTSTYPGGNFANLDPFQSSPNKPNPVLDEAQRLGISIVAPNQTLNGIKMSNDEFSTYQKYKGYYMALALGPVVHSSVYQNLADDEKATVFNEAKTQASTLVNNTIFPQLMIKRFNLPATTDPGTLKTLLNKLEQNPDFKKASTDKQSTVIKYWLGIK